MPNLVIWIQILDNSRDIVTLYFNQCKINPIELGGGTANLKYSKSYQIYSRSSCLKINSVVFLRLCPYN